MLVRRVSIMKMDKPVMVYDGECRFCRRVISRWRKGTANRVRYRSYQRVASQFPQVSVREFEQAVHFFESDGRWLRGADAVIRCLSFTHQHGGFVFLYSKLLILRWICRFCYFVVAGNRKFFSRLLSYLGWI